MMVFVNIALLLIWSVVYLEVLRRRRALQVTAGQKVVYNLILILLLLGSIAYVYSVIFQFDINKYYAIVGSLLVSLVYAYLLYKFFSWLNWPSLISGHQNSLLIDNNLKNTSVPHTFQQEIPVAITDQEHVILRSLILFFPFVTLAKKPLIQYKSEKGINVIEISYSATSKNKAITLEQILRNRLKDFNVKN